MTFVVDGTNGLTFPNSTTQASASKVLQVVQATYSTATTTTISATWQASGLAASITPSSTSSKILLIAAAPVNTSSLGTYAGYLTLFRGTVSGTNLGNGNNGMGNIAAFFNASPYTASYVAAWVSMNYLDSPNTTSSQTYTVSIRSEGNSNPIQICTGNGMATLTLMEIAA